MNKSEALSLIDQMSKSDDYKGYKLRYNSEKRIIEYKKRFRFTDLNGIQHDSETKWLPSPEQCKEYITARKYAAKQTHDEKLGKDTIGFVFKNFVALKEKEANVSTSEKISSRKTYAANASALYEHYLPNRIKTIKIKNLKPDHFVDMIAYINSDVEDHEILSGQRVRAFRYILHKFNEYLFEKHYISVDQENQNKYYLAHEKIKPKNSGSRNDRNFPKFDDFMSMTDYLKTANGGLGNFENLYWFIVLNLLFFTGLRAGELVGLKFKDINFEDDEGNGVIYFNDAISGKEIRENVEKREKKNNRSTKTKKPRSITMWEYYREYLKDYEQEYHRHYQVSKEKMQDMYVFPNVASKTDKTEFQRDKNILRKIQSICSKCGLEKFDTQMFRHGTAYFMCYVLGEKEEEVYDYFGHADSEMIREIYRSFNEDEKRINRAKIFGRFYKNNMSKKEIDDQIIKKLESGEELSKEIKESRIKLLYQQILAAKKKGEKQFFVRTEDFDLIDELLLAKEYSEGLNGIMVLNEDVFSPDKVKEAESRDNDIENAKIEYDENGSPISFNGKQLIDFNHYYYENHKDEINKENEKKQDEKEPKK